MKSILICALLALTVAGCSTLADARLAKGTGTKQTFAAPYDATWKATVCSLNAQGLSVAGENKDEGYILAQRGITAFSYGENVATFLTKISDKQTQVEVVSKKAMSTNIFAPDWSTDVLNGIQPCLGS